MYTRVKGTVRSESPIICVNVWAPPRFRATQIFCPAREIWAKPVFKASKTHFESRALMTAICDLEFIFRLCVLKVILSNNSSLCKVGIVRILSDVPFPREGEIY